MSVSVEGGTAFGGWMEPVAFLLALGVANWPLLSGSGVASALVLLPDRLVAGEWWRYPLHPPVHVSRYHLFIDALAFLLLLGELSKLSMARRWFVVTASAAGSGLAAILAAPVIADIGLCGLSGAAHGMFAAAVLESTFRARRPSERALAFTALMGVAGKCLYEVLVGQPLLTSVHLGGIGEPILVCHLGGFLGGCAAWTLPHLSRLGRALPNPVRNF